MKTTEKHFQEQAMVQSDLKKQLLEQSKLQKEVRTYTYVATSQNTYQNITLKVQRQSMSFAEVQSTQTRLLEEAHRQVSHLNI